MWSGGKCFALGRTMFSWTAIGLFELLASEARLSILGTLAKSGQAGMTTTHLSLRTGLRPRALRRHLDALIESGLVRRQRTVSGSILRVLPDRLDELTGFIRLRLTPRLALEHAPARRHELLTRSLRRKLETAASRSLADALAEATAPADDAIVDTADAAASEPRAPVAESAIVALGKAA